MVIPSGSSTVINNVAYQADTPDEAWSAVRDEFTATFTVKPGEFWPPDGPDKQRSELASSSASLAPFLQDWWISLWMKVSATQITSPWLVAGQMRGWDDPSDFTGRSPVFAQELYGLGGATTRFRVVTRASDEDPSTGNYAAITRYQDDTFQLGQWYRMVYRMQFARTGNGQLQAWKDGVEVISSTSLPIGYNDVQGPQWKFGIYRATGSGDPVTIKYANVEVGTTSLMGRVDSPLSLPSGA